MSSVGRPLAGSSTARRRRVAAVRVCAGATRVPYRRGRTRALTTNLAVIATLADGQLMTVESRLHSEFVDEESQEKKRRGATKVERFFESFA